MARIKKGDKVQILTGKDRGRTGTVERVLSKRGLVIVTGINVYKRHVRKHGQLEGGIIDIIKPVNISNLALICPQCKKPTRVGLIEQAGVKQRLCKRCRNVI